MSPNLNQQAQIARLQKLIAGIKKHLKGGSLVIAGKSYTADEAVALLQAKVDATLAVSPAKAAWTDVVQAADAQALQTKGFASRVRQSVKAMYSQVEVLADFGIAPPKQRTVPTTEAKAQAAAKAKATRAARHTMGSVQKSKITGTVPVTSGGSGSGPAPK